MVAGRVHGGLTLRWRRSAGACCPAGSPASPARTVARRDLPRQAARAPLMRFFPLQHTLATLRCPEEPLAGRSRYGVCRPCGVTLAGMQVGVAAGSGRKSTQDGPAPNWHLAIRRLPLPRRVSVVDGAAVGRAKSTWPGRGRTLAPAALMGFCPSQLCSCRTVACIRPRSTHMPLAGCIRRSAIASPRERPSVSIDFPEYGRSWAPDRAAGHTVQASRTRIPIVRAVAALGFCPLSGFRPPPRLHCGRRSGRVSSPWPAVSLRIPLPDPIRS